jgi:hypothetical protein
MFELLFIIAVLAWLFFSALESVLSLPCAPTIVAAFVAVPFVLLLRYRTLLKFHGLQRVEQAGRPVPPEKFYWPAGRKKLGWRLVVATCVVVSVWPVALIYPARWHADGASIIGWISGLIAIVTLSESLAAGWLYVKASHWFDRRAPGFVGWIRRALYRFSGNHEFLGEEPLPGEKRRREKVY